MNFQIDFIFTSSSYEVPYCHSSSTLTEGNHIDDFGLLIMETVSGRIPAYHSQTQVQLSILDSSVVGFQFCSLVFQIMNLT